MTLHSQGGAGAPRTLAAVFPPRLCDKSFHNNQTQKE
jgi:hypothetical protein